MSPLLDNIAYCVLLLLSCTLQAHCLSAGGNTLGAAGVVGSLRYHDRWGRRILRDTGSLVTEPASLGPTVQLDSPFAGAKVEYQVSEKSSRFLTWSSRDILERNKFEIAVTGLILLVLYVACSWYYHRHFLYTGPETAPTHCDKDEFTQWQVNLFQCYEDEEIGFWSFLCFGIRWSDTMSKAKVMGYWKAYWIMTFVLFLFFLPLAFPIVWLSFAALLTWGRQKLRERFAFPRIGGQTWFEDWCTDCWCPCCAIAQEAVHVRMALEAGHPSLMDPKVDEVV